MTLLLVVAVLGLGSTYYVLKALSRASSLSESRSRYNDRVLDEAKAALLMHVAKRVATETFPGKLPCPEDTSKIGTPAEGETQNFCALPAVGRLPWKSLDLDRAPLDFDGEPLWYAVSPGFNRTDAFAPLVINSNTPAGLTVDGSPARAVALIFAPGRPLNSQARGASPPAVANYLEGENATTDVNFVTYVAFNTANIFATVFNDQVAIVTHRDLFNVVEVEVARRMETLLVPALKSVYASPNWGTSSAAPLFPYAAPFSDPDVNNFQGTRVVDAGTAVGTFQGLLPLTFVTSRSVAGEYCTLAADGERCDPTFVAWSSFQSITKESGAMTLCSSPVPTCQIVTIVDLTPANGTSQLSCTIYTSSGGTLTINVNATASNVAMALRQLDTDPPLVAHFNSAGRSASASFNADGSAQVRFTGRIVLGASTGSFCLFPPMLARRRTFTIPIRILGDHPITNSSDVDHGWFLANNWHKLTYYAIAPAFAASGAQACTPGGLPECLTVNNLSPSNNKRAILILAGRAVGTQKRPPAIPPRILSDYLESENLTPVDSTFVTFKPSLHQNDRVITVDSN